MHEPMNVKYKLCFCLLFILFRLFLQQCGWR